MSISALDLLVLVAYKNEVLSTQHSSTAASHYQWKQISFIYMEIHCICCFKNLRRVYFYFVAHFLNEYFRLQNPPVEQTKTLRWKIAKVSTLIYFYTVIFPINFMFRLLGSKYHLPYNIMSRELHNMQLCINYNCTTLFTTNYQNC